jgi:hypothetical protein
MRPKDCRGKPARSRELGAFLKGLEMSFEGGGILTLGLEFGLQFLDEKFET